jgi:hypothetical protein
MQHDGDFSTRTDRRLSMDDFNFNIKTALPRSQPAKRAKADLLTTLILWVAIACLLLTPVWFDWGARFTFRNMLLSVLQVVQYALVPGLILWRLRIQMPLPQTVKRMVGGAVATLLGTIVVTWIATGGTAIGWLDWLELLMRFAVAGALLWYDGKSLRTITPLVVLGLFGLIMVVGAFLRVWDISTLTSADWKAYTFLNVRTSFAALEKLLLTGVVIGFAMKMARTVPLQGSPSMPAVGSRHSHEHTAQPSRLRTFLTSLSATTGAASKLIAVQTERTTLTTITLPTAYRALGKDCVQQKRHLQSVPELIEQLRTVMASLKSLSETAKSQPVAQSLTDKAKAAGKQAADLARQKQLGMKRDSLLAEIGRAIHDIHGEGSGAAEVVVPVREALDRLAALDADISRLSEVGKGSLLTPKRLAIGSGVAAVLLVSFVVFAAGSWMFGGKNSDTNGPENKRTVQSSGSSTLSGSKGFAQKVLDADPNLFTGTNVRSHKNVVKDFTPKHPAGTKADAIQAIAMLTPGMTTNNPPKFIRHNEGTSAFFGVRCNPALWNAVFGSPQSVRTNVHNKHEWIIRCSDGDLRCVGDILGNQYFGVDVVFKE